MEYKDVYKCLKESDFVIICKSVSGVFDQWLYYSNIVYSLNYCGLGKACAIDFRNHYMCFCNIEHNTFISKHGYNIKDYDEFKKILDSNNNMYCCEYTDIITNYNDYNGPVKKDYVQVYIYFNKNKFDLNFGILKPGIMRSIPGQTTYHMNIKNIEGIGTYKQTVNIVSCDINTLLNFLDKLNCDKNLKSKYYKQLVKAMCIRGNFKDRYEEVISFEDKIKILSVYKEITKEKEKRLKNGK